MFLHPFSLLFWAHVCFRELEEIIFFIEVAFEMQPFEGIKFDSAHQLSINDYQQYC